MLNQRSHRVWFAIQKGHTWNRKKGIFRYSCWRRWWSIWRPLSINPSCLALAPKKESNKLKAMATGTLALLAWSTAWIKAQLSLNRWSLNIQYTTGPMSFFWSFGSPDACFRTRIRPGWTDAIEVAIDGRREMEIWARKSECGKLTVEQRRRKEG